MHAWLIVVRSNRRLTVPPAGKPGVYGRLADPFSIDRRPCGARTWEDIAMRESGAPDHLGGIVL